MPTSYSGIASTIFNIIFMNAVLLLLLYSVAKVSDNNIMLNCVYVLSYCVNAAFAWRSSYIPGHISSSGDCCFNSVCFEILYCCRYRVGSKSMIIMKSYHIPSSLMHVEKGHYGC